jgi:hypothetical protein
MVFSLGGWSPLLPTGFLVPRGTQDSASVSALLSLRACHPLRMSFPEHSAVIQCSYLRGPTTPTLQQKNQNAELRSQICFFSNSDFCVLTFDSFVVGLVWAIPVSLAATQGISLDFSSSGY